MKTKEELVAEIMVEIADTKKAMNSSFADDKSDATNRVAMSNLYIALSNLIK